MQPGLIPEPLIAQIREQTDLAEVVSRYVTLKRAGRNLTGLCPFHSEKTPSFVVSPAKQVFHCFGCQTGGNVFTFMMKIEGRPFAQTVRSLADRLGVALPERPLTPEQQREMSERDTLYRVNQAAADFFHDHLLHAPDAQPARRYLSERGITDATIATFRIGFAPAAWDGLLRHLRRAGWTDDAGERAGLIVVRDAAAGGRGYDRFRARVMFPILDLQERVIGFGGRVLDPTQQPKYLNSPETPVFHKGRSLYLLERARAGAARGEPLVVVEGYFDALMAHQAGITTVVATLGTALTPEHLTVLRRFVSTLRLIFDPDAAGVRAALRAVETILPTGVAAQVVLLPGQDDPDGFIRRCGADAFRALLDQGIEPLEFALRQHLAHPEAVSPTGRERITHALLPMIRRVESELLRGYYIKRLAEALGFKEEDLTRALGRSAAKPGQAPTAKAAPAPLEEQILVHLALHGFISPTRLLNEVPLEEFSDARLRGALEAARRSEERFGSVRLDAAVDAEQTEAGVVETIAALSVETPETRYEDPQRTLIDCLDHLKQRRQQRSLDEIEFQIRSAERAGDHALVKNLQAQFITLKKQILPRNAATQTQFRAG